MNTTTSVFSRIEYARARRATDSTTTKRTCVGVRLAGFFKQLRERKVCRAAAAYAIFSWVLLQLGEIIFPSLGLPPWTLTLVVVVAIAGFPVAMILAWVLQWTDDGLVVDVPQGNNSASGSRVDSLLSIALLLTAIVLSAELVWSIPDVRASAPAPATDSRIAIIPFIAEDQASATDAATIEQYLRHELVGTDQYPLTLVAGISSEEAYSSQETEVPLNWVIEGSVGIEKGKARMLLHLIELPQRRYHESWTFQPSAKAPTHRDMAKTAVAAIVNYLDQVDSAPTP